MLNRLPLRLLLTLPYVLLLLVLAAVVGWLSYHSADQAIDDMAAKLHASSGERIQEATAAYLTNWQYVVAAATAPEPNAGPVTLPPIERALWMASGLSSERPSYVYFSAPDGRFVGVERSDGQPALLKLRDEPGSAPRRLYHLRQPADRSQAVGAETQTYVALTRPWYAAAVATTGEVWSPVYLDFSTRLPMITLTLAQRNDAGALLGVYGADVPLAQIGGFLRDLQIAKQGLAYIVSSDGRVIGSSLPEAGASAQQELPLASASTNPLLQASFNAIDKLATSNGRATLIDSAQGKMLVSVSPLRHRAGLDWRVVVVLPQALLTAGIDRNALRTVLLTGLAALAALAIGTLILRSLAGEIGALTRAAEQLSAQQTPSALHTQRRDELGRLSNAFDQMVARLDTSSRARDDAERRLQGVTDAMNEGFIVLDPQWRIGYANKVTQAMSGTPIADVLGKVLWEAFPTLPGTELETALRQAAQSGQPLTIETWRERAGRWIEVRLFPSALGMAVFFSDVTQRRTQREALADRQRQLQHLAGELLTAQSEERRSIARELHDEMGQQLAALHINLQVLRTRAHDDAERARLDDSLAIAAEVIAQVRNRALDLHPQVLDDLGLAAALHWMCERKAQRSSVAIHLHEASPLPALAPRIGLACFRIAQEAMINALKHGQPRRIDLTYGAEDGQVHLAIADDGAGFDPAAGSAAGQSLGLISMRERAQQLGGTLAVTSQHNRGTRVEVRIPIVSDA